MFTSAMNDVLDRTNNPLIPMDPDMVGDGDIEITRQQNRNYCIAEGFRRIAKESNAIGLMLRYRAQAEREYRRAVEDFDRLKSLRAQPATRAGVVCVQTKSHEMPNEPNIGLEPEPEDIVPIEELNWELPHIRIEQQKKANRAMPNEPTVLVPNEPTPGGSPSPQSTSGELNEATAAQPNEPNAVSGSGPGGPDVPSGARQPGGLLPLAGGGGTGSGGDGNTRRHSADRARK